MNTINKEVTARMLTAATIDGCPVPQSDILKSNFSEVLEKNLAWADCVGLEMETLRRLEQIPCIQKQYYKQARKQLHQHPQPTVMLLTNSFLHQDCQPLFSQIKNPKIILTSKSKKDISSSFRQASSDSYTTDFVHWPNLKKILSEDLGFSRFLFVSYTLSPSLPDFYDLLDEIHIYQFPYIFQSFSKLVDPEMNTKSPDANVIWRLWSHEIIDYQKWYMQYHKCNQLQT